MNKLKRFILMIVCGVFSQGLLAQTIYPKSLEPFYDAKVVKDKSVSTRNYTLALGTYKKIGNRWQIDKKLRLAGDVLKQTHEIPRDYSVQEVYDFYASQLAGQSEVLYACEGFNCGSSNNWANVHFGVRELYGLDRHQYFYAAKLDTGEYAIVYVVRRGNRRIFAQVEIIKPVEQ